MDDAAATSTDSDNNIHPGMRRRGSTLRLHKHEFGHTAGTVNLLAGNVSLPKSPHLVNPAGASSQAESKLLSLPNPAQSDFRLLACRKPNLRSNSDRLPVPAFGDRLGMQCDMAFYSLALGEALIP
ncbi:hypothetical protein K431DRAFT_29961 [Polychaeton citri CBS 116435]|uniref:Uncharacterized protein n=1 Tax=Polychaeton citri CBS 116435 TaxID=1314669 RepID=A0A9P4UJ77_9PEZI|nr:hypothetical protein K431DRAFT_29961 [Polychaeton citri CBS 116435]